MANFQQTGTHLGPWLLGTNADYSSVRNWNMGAAIVEQSATLLQTASGNNLAFVIPAGSMILSISFITYNTAFTAGSYAISLGNAPLAGGSLPTALGVSTVSITGPIANYTGMADQGVYVLLQGATGSGAATNMVITYMVRNPDGVYKPNTATITPTKAPITTTITAAGSSTITIPSGYTTATIEAWGGGGGNGGHYYSGGCCPVDVWSSTGGSGGYSRSVVSVAGQGGRTLSVTVGAGGTAGVDQSVYYGGQGGDTTVSSGTLSITTVTAGGGGSGNTYSNGGGVGGPFAMTASCTNTTLTITVLSTFPSIWPVLAIRGGATPVTFNTFINSGSGQSTGTFTVTKSQNFTSQSINIYQGYGGQGGVSSGGTVNISGVDGNNSSNSGSITSPLPVRGIAGLYGRAASGDSTPGSAGAVAITYS